MNCLNSAFKRKCTKYVLTAPIHIQKEVIKWGAEDIYVHGVAVGWMEGRDGMCKSFGKVGSIGFGSSGTLGRGGSSGIFGSSGFGKVVISGFGSSGSFGSSGFGRLGTCGIGGSSTLGSGGSSGNLGFGSSGKVVSKRWRASTMILMPFIDVKLTTKSSKRTDEFCEWAIVQVDKKLREMEANGFKFD